MAIICGAGAGAGLAATLEAGRTPSMPLPVPWPGGCGGSSERIAGGTKSFWPCSTLFSEALAMTAFEVSGTLAVAGEIELVIGAEGCDELAEASLMGPALT